jgi:hypothetical protein
MDPQIHEISRNVKGPFGSHEATCTCGWLHAGGVGKTAERGTTHAINSHRRAVRKEAEAK